MVTNLLAKNNGNNKTLIDNNTLTILKVYQINEVQRNVASQYQICYKLLIDYVRLIKKKH